MVCYYLWNFKWYRESGIEDLDSQKDVIRTQ